MQVKTSRDRNCWKIYRDNHAMTFTNRSAASEEGDDKDDTADNDQCYRWEYKITSETFHFVSILFISYVHENAHDQDG